MIQAWGDPKWPMAHPPFLISTFADYMEIEDRGERA